MGRLDNYMSYFPAFIQLQNKKILLVGGGKIALEKLGKLLDFTNEISIIALSISDEMLQKINTNNLHYEQREYKTGDVEGFSLVIVAVDSLVLQEEIFLESKQYNCLCNSVDSVDFCDFIFPSYIKKDELTIAISTSGASPAFAKHFKTYLAALLPKGITEFLSQMKSLRQTLPKGEERMKMLDKKAKDYVSKL